MPLRGYAGDAPISFQSIPDRPPLPPGLGENQALPPRAGPRAPGRSCPRLRTGPGAGGAPSRQRAQRSGPPCARAAPPGAAGAGRRTRPWARALLARERPHRGEGQLQQKSDRRDKKAERGDDNENKRKNDNQDTIKAGKTTTWTQKTSEKPMPRQQRSASFASTRAYACVSSHLAPRETNHTQSHPTRPPSQSTTSTPNPTQPPDTEAANTPPHTWHLHPHVALAPQAAGGAGETWAGLPSRSKPRAGRAHSATQDLDGESPSCQPARPSTRRCLAHHRAKPGLHAYL